MKLIYQKIHIILINFIWLALVLSFLTPIYTKAAEFAGSYLTKDSGKDSPMGCSFDLYIKGSIKKGDAAAVKKILDNACYEESRYKTKRVVFHVNLNSDGGDVNEALEVGRVIRAKGAFTRVWNQDVCLSSCVFVLMGGQSRQVMGKVGIHRPYFADLNPNATLPQIQKAREDMNVKISQYVREMDIAPTIVELMMSVPPEKMKILSEADLESYRLDGIDAAYDEKQVAEYASNWNISSATYRVRDSQREKKCGSVLEAKGMEAWRNYQICNWSIMLAISSALAEKKVDSSINECPKDSEKRLACLKRLRTTN
jgi:ATP-dependent protease ClpP protease subunit